eukprot:11454090-Karenia_brevis.AAC.1
MCIRDRAGTGTSAVEERGGTASSRAVAGLLLIKRVALRQPAGLPGKLNSKAGPPVAVQVLRQVRPRGR